MEMPEFHVFAKIPRIYRNARITEKIDGTNAQVLVTDDGRVLAGSRTRWITKENDNFGFAAWVEEHADELRGLGPGRHYGEWWGPGIQRGYGMAEKRFSLFNVTKWDGAPDRPKCCHVVPSLDHGPFSLTMVTACLQLLRIKGSRASPGFMRPEGVVVFHEASGHLYKATLENDGQPKTLY